MENIYLLLDENGHIKNRDIEQRHLMLFFASIVNISDRLWHPRCPELENSDCSNNKIPANSKLVCDLLLHLDTYKFLGLMGFIPRYYESWPISSQLFSMVLGIGKGPS